MSPDEKLREQVARIQAVAHEQDTAGKRPDFVIVAKWSPLGQLTKATVATAIGELRVLPDPLCPNGNEFVGSLDDYPQMKAWTDRDCPHGYGFDCCTQCHDAFHAGRASVAAEVKPTHEERARAWVRALPVYTEAQGVAYLSTAFAEVEAEAKREMVARRDFRCPHGQPEFGVCGACTIAPIPAPGTSGLPVPQFCQECGKKPCETFIVCTMKEMERSERARLAAGPVVCAELTKGDGKIQMPCSRERDHRGPHALRASMRFESEAQFRAYYGLEWPTPAAKSCTCGAASCGSRLHSDYCDSFGVV